MSIGTYPCRWGACIGYNMYTLPHPNHTKERASSAKPNETPGCFSLFCFPSLFTYIQRNSGTARACHCVRAANTDPSQRDAEHSYMYRPLQTKPNPSRLAPFFTSIKPPHNDLHERWLTPRARKPLQPNQTKPNTIVPTNLPTQSRFTSCSAPAAPACAPAWWAAPRAAAQAWAPPSWPWPARGRAP